MLRLLPLAVAVGALFYAHPAAAAPTGRLVYSHAPGAESCPDEATMRRAVAARVGYDPFFPMAPRTVVVSMERRDRDFVATVSLVDEQGVAHGGRQLKTKDSCAELLGAAALAIAIAIDPAVLAGVPARPQPEPSPTPVPPPAPAPPAPMLPPPPPIVAVPPGPASHACPAVIGVSLGAVASSGAAPDLAAGVLSGAELLMRPVHWHRSASERARVTFIGRDRGR
jgi:hypothetical protein